MDDGLKQRIVGAVVLIAVAVIFVPTLFDNSRRAVDTTSQVPPEPVVVAEPLEVPQPERPEVGEAQPAFADNYAHPPVAEPDQATAAADEAGEEVEGEAEGETAVDASPEPVPVLTTGDPETVSGLTEEGIPQAWSVQVGSFSERERAERMLDTIREQGYQRSYIREGQGANGPLFRVFVGPKISKADAQAVQRQVDEALAIDSLIVRFQP